MNFQLLNAYPDSRIPPCQSLEQKDSWKKYIFTRTIVNGKLVLILMLPFHLMRLRSKFFQDDFLCISPIYLIGGI